MYHLKQNKHNVIHFKHLFKDPCKHGITNIYVHILSYYIVCTTYFTSVQFMT